MLENIRNLGVSDIELFERPPALKCGWLFFPSPCGVRVAVVHRIRT